MSKALRSSVRTDRGQAAVEFVALLPLVVLGLFGAWQVVLAAHTAWSAHAAARAVARAHAVGGDELAAARRSLPSSLDSRVRVLDPDGEGRAVVRVAIPAVVPGLGLGSVTAHAGFVPQS
jgi:Flp pilus assembly protein TadG